MEFQTSHAKDKFNWIDYIKTRFNKIEFMGIDRILLARFRTGDGLNEHCNRIPSVIKDIDFLRR
jgi:hypothetical protein